MGEAKKKKRYRALSIFPFFDYLWLSPWRGEGFLDPATRKRISTPRLVDYAGGLSWNALRSLREKKKQPSCFVKVASHTDPSILGNAWERLVIAF